MTMMFVMLNGIVHSLSPSPSPSRTLIRPFEEDADAVPVGHATVGVWVALMQKNKVTTRKPKSTM